MGWGSATHLFDESVDVTLSFLQGPWGQSPSEALIAAVVEKTYKDIDWDDWDTQDESKYVDYLIHVRHAMGEVDDDYYEWYTKGKPDDFDWS